MDEVKSSFSLCLLLSWARRRLYSQPLQTQRYQAMYAYGRSKFSNSKHIFDSFILCTRRSGEFWCPIPDTHKRRVNTLSVLANTLEPCHDDALAVPATCVKAR